MCMVCCGVYVSMRRMPPPPRPALRAQQAQEVLRAEGGAPKQATAQRPALHWSFCDAVHTLRDGGLRDGADFGILHGTNFLLEKASACPKALSHSELVAMLTSADAKALFSAAYAVKER